MYLNLQFFILFTFLVKYFGAPNKVGDVLRLDLEFRSNFYNC